MDSGYEDDVDHRLKICSNFIDFKDKTILDLGCGDGKYSRKMKLDSNVVFGLDIEEKAVSVAKDICSAALMADAQFLPFRDSSFDIILMSDIIEHVGDDKATMSEAYRCLNKNGYIIIFAPNRLYPFEVHGIVLKNKVVRIPGLGTLVPLINYFPRVLRNRLVPHARIYSANDLVRLVEKVPLVIKYRYYTFPHFELFRPFPKLRNNMIKLSLFLEKSRLKIFGEDHLFIMQK